MSHYACEICGTACYDSPTGYVTGCIHYPPDIKHRSEGQCSQCGMANIPVDWERDPYLREVYGEDEYRWFCAECFDNRFGDC